MEQDSMTTHTEHKAGDLPDEIWVTEVTRLYPERTTREFIAVSPASQVLQDMRTKYVKAALSPPVDGWRDKLIEKIRNEAESYRHFKERGGLTEYGDGRHDAYQELFALLPQPPKDKT